MFYKMKYKITMILFCFSSKFIVKNLFLKITKKPVFTTTMKRFNNKKTIIIIIITIKKK